MTHGYSDRVNDKGKPGIFRCRDCGFVGNADSILNGNGCRSESLTAQELAESLIYAHAD